MFGLSTALFPQATIVSHLNPPCNVDQFSGGSREGAWGGPGPHTLFFFRNEAGRAEKIYFGDRRPPPPYLRVWMTTPPPLYLMVWICHCSLQCLGADSRVL